MSYDAIVDEVHRIREEYAAQFNYDLWAMYRDLKELEEKDKASGRKVVSFPPKRIQRPPAVEPKAQRAG